MSSHVSTDILEKQIGSIFGTYICSRSEKILLGEQGVAYLSGKKRTCVRWNDIKRISHSLHITPGYDDHERKFETFAIWYGEPEQLLEFRLPRDAKLEMQRTLRFGSGWDAGTGTRRTLECLLEATVANRYLEDTKTRFNHNEEISFGALAISKEGIRYQGVLVPWIKVEALRPSPTFDIDLRDPISATIKTTTVRKLPAFLSPFRRFLPNALTCIETIGPLRGISVPQEDIHNLWLLILMLVDHMHVRLQSITYNIHFIHKSMEYTKESIPVDADITDHIRTL